MKKSNFCDKEHPIIFNTEMIKAVLDDRKTQTRRPLKNVIPSTHYFKYLITGYALFEDDNVSNGRNKDNIPVSMIHVKCPYGKVGDIFPILEKLEDGTIVYTGEDGKITNVMVENIHEIMFEGMLAEGVKPETYLGADLRAKFIDLWNSIYAKEGYGWDANLRVWVITFRRLT